jgi:hypothetical protein
MFECVSLAIITQWTTTEQYLSPSTSSILSEIDTYSRHPQPLAEHDLDAMLALLKGLPPELDADNRAKIWVPDTERYLRRVDDIYYDDIGDTTGHLGNMSRPLAHAGISSRLAANLGLSSIGLETLDVINLAQRDYQEDLTTRIRNTLKEYTIHQSLSEFLANALDAGATDFTVLLDELPYPSQRLLSPDMEAFQECPSLVLYHDSLFKEDDWLGIMNIGIGGKSRRSDSIGMFGLGALAMYHFTEVRYAELNLNIQGSQYIL